MSKVHTKCPSCYKEAKVPYDRGTLKITCPHCSNVWKWDGFNDLQKGNIKSYSKEAIKKIIEHKVSNIRNYTCDVGIFGVTGVGKSSLCNALFGRDVAAISDVAACTREPQSILIKSNQGDGGINLIDVPGLGETQERDAEYFELYKKISPNLDLIVWVIKADDRAYSGSQKAYNDILKPNLKNCPVIFVINQVDKLPPLQNWDIVNNIPGESQKTNIKLKIQEVSKAFNVPVDSIIDASVSNEYNMVSVISLIVDKIPNEKKFSIVREARENVKNDDIKFKAEKGILDFLSDIASSAWEAVKPIVIDIITHSAPILAPLAKKTIEKLYNFLFR